MNYKLIIWIDEIKTSEISDLNLNRRNNASDMQNLKLNSRNNTSEISDLNLNRRINTSERGDQIETEIK